MRWVCALISQIIGCVLFYVYLFIYFDQQVCAGFELNCPESRMITLVIHRILQSYGLHSYNNILIYSNISSHIQDESLKMS